MGNVLSCKCLRSDPLIVKNDVTQSSLNLAKPEMKSVEPPKKMVSIPAPSTHHSLPRNLQRKTSVVKNEEEVVLIAAHNKKKLTVQDFLVEKIIGKGAFGKVMLVKKVNNPTKVYAMKIMKKSDIYNNKLVENIVLEKNILQKSRHPFVVDLKYAFQSSAKIYLVMEYLEGGELFNLLRKNKRFNEDAARFYLAEVFLAIDYLHKEMKIIYRDLKPENVLLTAQGHVKITDFGLSKQTDNKAYTFAGTPEYLAPEILINRGHTKSVDFWALGILLFEMMAGKPPFTSHDRNFLKIEKLIIENKPHFPEFFSTEAVDFLKGLLESNPEKRLGAQSADDIKNHAFFKSLNWDVLYKKKINPPFAPDIRRQAAFNNNAGMEIKESLDNQILPNLPGITYNPDNLLNSQRESGFLGSQMESKALKNKVNEIVKRK